MTGMNRNTGFTSTDSDHLAQSIGDILSTPLGSRVMRRDYGSLLPELIDAPQSPQTRQLIMASTAKAINQWEPRLNLQRTMITFNANGQASVTIIGEHVNSQGRAANENRNTHVRFTIPITANPMNASAL